MLVLLLRRWRGRMIDVACRHLLLIMLVDRSLLPLLLLAILDLVRRALLELLLLLELRLMLLILLLASTMMRPIACLPVARLVCLCAACCAAAF